MSWNYAHVSHRYNICSKTSDEYNLTPISIYFVCLYVCVKTNTVTLTFMNQSQEIHINCLFYVLIAPLGVLKSRPNLLGQCVADHKCYACQSLLINAQVLSLLLSTHPAWQVSIQTHNVLQSLAPWSQGFNIALTIFLTGSYS